MWFSALLNPTAWRLFFRVAIIVGAFFAGWKTHAYTTEVRTLREANNTLNNTQKAVSEFNNDERHILEEALERNLIINDASKTCNAPVDPCISDLIDRLQRDGS